MRPIFPVDNTICLLHCFSLIQKNYMDNDSFIVLVNSKLELDVPVFRLDYTGKMSTTNLFRRKFDLYLIDCSNLILEDFMDALSSEPSFYSASHFIFFCEVIKEETLLVLKRFEILKMIFLNTSSGNISTYYPYKKRMFQQFDISLTVIGRCNIIDKHEKQRLIQLFPNKIPKKWINTTLNIFHSYAPPYSMGTKGKMGIELDVQMLILNRLGMTPNFTKIDLPETGKKQTITSILKGNYCDYMIGVSSPTEYFEFTIPYIYDDLMWYVPSARKLSKRRYLFEILNRFVWLCWMFSSMSAIVSLYIHDSFLYGEGRITTFLDKFWIFYRLFLEQTVSFRTKYLSEIFLIAVFIFGTFMMNLIYKSRFFYFLTAVRYENDLKSVEDIMDNGLKIGFLDWHKRMFQDNERLVSYLKNHFQSCNLQANCSDQAAFSKDIAVLRPRIKMTYWTRRYTDKKGRSLLKRIESPVSDLFWVVAFSPGHPLFHSINQYIFYFLDYGIMKKIMSKYSVEGYRTPVLPETRQLSYSHVEVPIICWAFGMFMGIAVLIFEIKCRPSKSYDGKRIQVATQP